MKIEDIKAGIEIKFTPTGNIFKIAKVTETRVSWYVNHHKGGTGKNILKMVWVTKEKFEKGIKNGSYILIK